MRFIGTLTVMRIPALFTILPRKVVAGRTPVLLHQTPSWARFEIMGLEGPGPNPEKPSIPQASIQKANATTLVEANAPPTQLSREKTAELLSRHNMPSIQKIIILFLRCMRLGLLHNLSPVRFGFLLLAMLVLLSSLAIMPQHSLLDCVHAGGHRCANVWKENT